MPKYPKTPWSLKPIWGRSIPNCKARIDEKGIASH
jgi:hypothetical protein